SPRDRPERCYGAGSYGTAPSISAFVHKSGGSRDLGLNNVACSARGQVNSLNEHIAAGNSRDEGGEQRFPVGIGRDYLVIEAGVADVEHGAGAGETARDRGGAGTKALDQRDIAARRRPDDVKRRGAGAVPALPDPPIIHDDDADATELRGR
ncbi:MAG: hypothetical protein ACOC0P_01925, partial [Planctomycetota bacterium]